MSRWILILLTTVIIGCSSTTSQRDTPTRSSRNYYVSCPPNVFYCYRKSDLICYRGYRVLTVSPWEENPEMVIECK